MTEHRELEIAFLGGGNMAEALISGLVRAGHDAARVRVGEPAAARRRELETRYDVRAEAENAAAIAGADVVVLAVKPQQLEAVAAEVAASLPQAATLVSIAAGVGSDRLAALFGEAASIVRVMPNTPALVGEGMAVLFSRAPAPHGTRAAYVMNAAGETAWVEDEALMHAVTAVSGSGPAYFFLLCELLQAAGEELGLSRELAGRLAVQTAAGAGRMLRDSGRPADELRRQVTSPGGTTEAALKTMYERRLPEAVREAVAAAARRSRELG